MQVGNDGIAIITICNPPVNVLSLPGTNLRSFYLFTFLFSHNVFIHIYIYINCLSLGPPDIGNFFIFYFFEIVTITLSFI